MGIWNKQLGALGAAVGLTVAASSGCSQSGDPVQAKLQVEAGAPLIDVREPSEYQERHLPRALNIPVGSLETRLSELDKLVKGDRTQPIVV